MISEYAPVKEDFQIEKIETDECELCDQPATHYLTFDLRAFGAKTVLGKYCFTCAMAQLERARKHIQ